jgi:hypothetical protein
MCEMCPVTSLFNFRYVINPLRDNIREETDEVHSKDLCKKRTKGSLVDARSFSNRKHGEEATVQTTLRSPVQLEQLTYLPS